MKRLSRLVHLLSPFRLKFALAICSAIIGSIGVVAVPYVVQRFLKPLISHEQATIGMNAWLAIVAGMVFLTVSTYFGYRGMFSVAHEITADLRKKFVQLLLMLPLQTSRTMQSGELLDKFVRSVSDIEWFFKHTLLLSASVLVLAVGAVVMLVMLSWKLTLVLGILVAVAVIGLHRLFHRVRLARQDEEQLSGNLLSRIHEILLMRETIKAFTAEESEHNRFLHQQEKMKNIQRTLSRFIALLEPAIFALSLIVVIVILLFGGILVSREELSIETLIGFVLYTALIVPQARLVSLVVMRWQHANAGLDFLDQFFAQQPEFDSSEAQPLRFPIKGTIEVQHVSYRYQDREQALHDVSFRVEAGECMAVVGMSGAGKSTLFHLLLRFFDPVEGMISIDGMNIKKVTRESLRRAISIVPQDVLLFNTTLWENVRYGKPDASDEQISRACSAAQVEAFIDSLPQKYETLVGERGVQLSGGQRQRIAIARAFLKDAPILLLDEVTSSLDSETERELQDAMRELIRGRTTMIIAHRLATVTNVPKIIVLHRGKILAQGSHERLLDECEQYRILVTNQFITQTSEQLRNR